MFILRKHLLLRFFALLLVAPVLAGASEGVNDEVVGEVTGLSGNAVAMQDALPRTLSVGAPIHIRDVLSTGRDSRLKVRMMDEAEFALGERSVFVVEEYFLKPESGEGGNAVIRLMSGSIQAVTGKIAQLDGNPFELHTAVATIGVRGTEFWGGLLDGIHQFALLDGRAIVVENRAGRIEITRIGDGTTVADDTASPTAPSAWSQDKLDRAAAMTSVP